MTYASRRRTCRELGKFPAGIAHREICHECRWRSPPSPGDDRFHLIRRALHSGLDGAVVTIAHPARHAELPRLLLHSVAESHALDPTGNPEMPDDGHARKHTTSE